MLCLRMSLFFSLSEILARRTIARRVLQKLLRLTSCIVASLFLVVNAASYDGGYPYQLKVEPATQTVNLPQRFSVDLVVYDATDNLRMNYIRFNVTIDPGLVSVPGSFGTAGNFIPSSVLWKDSVSSGAVTSATYTVGGFSTGSFTSSGQLARLYFDALQPGLADMRLSVIAARNVDNTPIPSPALQFGQVVIVDPNATPTPTPTPTMTETPTPTETPTATPTPVFSLSMDPLARPVQVGDVALLPIVVSEASPELSISEIHLEVSINNYVNPVVLFQPQYSVVGPFIPGATMVFTELLPSASQAVQARLSISNGQIAGSTLRYGSLADLAVLANHIGYAEVFILSASGVLDASGNSVRAPDLPAAPALVRVNPPVSGLSLDVSPPDSRNLLGTRVITRFELDDPEAQDVFRQRP